MQHEPRGEKLTNSRALALIVARSVQLRDSLLVLLRAIPQIEAVHQVETGAEALALMSEIQPDLVLLDYGQSDVELRTTLAQIRSERPQARSLVLLDEDKGRSVEDVGADVILIKGTRAATLLETIRGLLSDAQ